MSLSLLPHDNATTETNKIDFVDTNPFKDDKYLPSAFRIHRFLNVYMLKTRTHKCLGRWRLARYDTVQTSPLSRSLAAASSFEEKQPNQSNLRDWTSARPVLKYILLTVCICHYDYLKSSSTIGNLTISI